MVEKSKDEKLYSRKSEKTADARPLSSEAGTCDVPTL